MYLVHLERRGALVVETTSLATSMYRRNKLVVDEAAKTLRVR